MKGYLGKSFLLIAGVLLLLGCDDDEKRSQSSSNCTQTAYIQLGDYLFRVSRSQLNYMTHNGNSVHAGCDTAPERPLIVDRLSFIETFSLSEYKEKITLQFNLQISPLTRRDYFQEIRLQLKSKGLTIETLPKEMGYYKFVYDQKSKAAHYVSDNPLMVDSHKEPLVLSSCSPPEVPISCNLIFDWRPDVNVFVRSLNYPERTLPTGSIKIWERLYEEIIQELDDITVPPVQ